MLDRLLLFSGEAVAKISSLLTWMFAWFAFSCACPPSDEIFFPLPKCRASDNRERAYEHSAYGHHERGTGGFDRTRHYDQDYYRDPRERTLQHGLYYTSRSRSPNRFDAHDPRYEPRAREQFTLPSVVHRDIYRDDITREVRGRRPERNYQHSRSRSPHSSQSRTQSPQRLASQASRPTRSPSGSGSRSRSSSSDSISSSSSTSSDR